MKKFFNSAVKQVKRFEGFSPVPYQCLSGFTTIGYGFNLQRNYFSKKNYAILGKLFVNSIESGISIGKDWQGLTMQKEIAEEILLEDLTDLWTSLTKSLPWVELTNETVQLVLLDMAYNMGIHGLLDFKKTLFALEAGNWETAATELKDSRWFNQVGTRAKEHIAAIMDLGVESMTPIQRLARLESKIKEITCTS